MAEPSSNPILNAASALQNTTASKLKDLEGLINEATASSKERLMQIKADTVKVSGYTDAMKIATEAAAGANEVINSVTQMASMKAQNDTIDAFNTAGSKELQAELLATLQVDIKRTQELQAKAVDISNDEYTGIEYIDAIINDYAGFKTQMELSAAQEKQDATTHSLQTMAAATESVNVTNNLTKKTINEATIAAEATKIRSAGEIAVAQQNIANVKHNSDQMAQVYAANADQLNIHMQSYKLSENVEDRAFQREVQAQNKIEFDLRMKEHPLRMQAMQLDIQRTQISIDESTDPRYKATRALELERKEAQMAQQIQWEQDVVTRVQTGESSRHLPLTDPATIIYNLQQGSAETKDRMQKLYSIGSTPNAIAGSDPYEAMVTTRTVDPTGNAPITKYDEILTEASEAIEALYVKSPELRPKTEEGVRQGFNATVQTALDTYAKNIKSGDATNPYAAPPLESLAAVKAVKESALYQKVLKPKNLTETNPQVIFDATIEGIQAGVLDPQQAARDYSTLFKAAVDSNNKMNGGFRRLGMPDQKEYNTMITRPPSYLESDLANLRLLPTTFTAGIVAPFSSALSDKLNAAANYSKRNAPNLREVIDVTDVTKVQHRIIQALNTAKPKNPSSAPSTTLTTK